LIHPLFRPGFIFSTQRRRFLLAFQL
jgi:hypothetical protein